MKNNYQMLSYYYDEIMHVMNYKDMLAFTKQYLNLDSHILDLACGSGTLAILLKLNHYQVSGLDISQKMLEVAKEKAKMNHTDIDLQLGDMINFKHNKKYDCITCFFDSINMLSSLNDVKQMFKNVHNHLQTDGIFIFDIFSKSKYQECNHLRFKEDLNWFKYDWKLKTKKPNILVHKIRIAEGAKRVKEQYFEYFYDYKDIIDNELFDLVKLSGDFKDSLSADDERIVIVLKKKKSF